MKKNQKYKANTPECKSQIPTPTCLQGKDQPVAVPFQPFQRVSNPPDSPDPCSLRRKKNTKIIMENLYEISLGSCRMGMTCIKLCLSLFLFPPSPSPSLVGEKEGRAAYIPCASGGGRVSCGRGQSPPMPYFWKCWKGEGIGGFAMYEYVG